MAITTQRDGASAENQWTETRTGDLPVRVSASMSAKGCWQLDVTIPYAHIEDALAEGDFAEKVAALAQTMRERGLRLAGDKDE